jgi:hypothetical protein
MTVNVVPDPNKDPIRRLTNQELWERVLAVVHGRDHLEEYHVVSEFERRLRKIAFLPARPSKDVE